MCLIGTAWVWTYTLPATTSSEFIGPNTTSMLWQGARRGKSIVENLCLNMPPVGTDAEAAGGLWARGLLRDGYPGY